VNVPPETRVSSFDCKGRSVLNRLPYRGAPTPIHPLFFSFIIRVLLFSFPQALPFGQACLALATAAGLSGLPLDRMETWRPWPSGPAAAGGAAAPRRSVDWQGRCVDKADWHGDAAGCIVSFVRVETPRLGPLFKLKFRVWAGRPGPIMISKSGDD
jgi:hypothetical protein